MVELAEGALASNYLRRCQAGKSALTATNATESVSAIDYETEREGSLPVGIASGGLSEGHSRPIQCAGSWLSRMDESVKARFNLRAAACSDRLLACSLITPILLSSVPGVDVPLKTVFTTQFKTMAMITALTQAVKIMAARRRPYTYNTRADVEIYAKAQGEGAKASFYSNHASATFASAVFGSMLFVLSTTDPKIRAGAISGQFAMAALATQLRVVAGQHFYTDILAGAFAGLVCGASVPTRDGFTWREAPFNASDILTAIAGLVIGTYMSGWYR